MNRDPSNFGMQGMPISVVSLAGVVVAPLMPGVRVRVRLLP